MKETLSKLFSRISMLFPSKSKQIVFQVLKLAQVKSNLDVKIRYRHSKYFRI